MIWQNAIKKQQLLQQQKNIGYSFNGRDMEHTRSKGFKKFKTGRLYFFFFVNSLHCATSHIVCRPTRFLL